MRTTCEKYFHINVSCKYRKIVHDLSWNKNIMIMKQDKGRGVLVMGRGKYFNKCLAMLNTEQFVQLQKDPISSLERRVQRTYWKIKQKLPTDVYAKLYPTGSSPGKFYGTAKVHYLSLKINYPRVTTTLYYIKSKHCYVSVSTLFGKNIIPSEPFIIYCRQKQ